MASKTSQDALASRSPITVSISAGQENAFKDRDSFLIPSKHKKDIGSTLKGTIGKGSIGQLLVSTAGQGFGSFVTIEQTRRGKVKDGDAFATLAYLLSKADSDLLFLGKFTLKDGRLDSLVWVDGANVVDYECFGDVLAFDTTYKKNVYNKPLVIFSGTNHHGQTTIFGCAMLLDERSETFKWALKKFLEIMSEKPPGGVVTDGDHATREAILECTVQIFEERWSEIISKYGLAENEWVQGIYNDKMKWATTYLREHFFGRIRATSQLFETRGLPCSHIFGVLKYHNTKCVPSSLILKRWTRDAKIDFICSIGEQDSADDIVPTLRCGAMASIC
ncbi:hypothetical protein AHAS_Ahas06G0152200 [Arachis hypogaea]